MDDGSFESRPSKRLSRSPALNFRARCPSAADFANDSSRHVAARRNARRRAAALGVRLRFRYSPVVSPTFERTFRDARVYHTQRSATVCLQDDGGFIRQLAQRRAHGRSIAPDTCRSLRIWKQRRTRRRSTRTRTQWVVHHTRPRSSVPALSRCKSVKGRKSRVDINSFIAARLAAGTRCPASSYFSPYRESL